MLFKNVIGQADVKTHLVNMVQQDRISHALLFLGKKDAARCPGHCICTIHCLRKG